MDIILKKGQGDGYLFHLHSYQIHRENQSLYDGSNIQAN
jgi:hypothetical protein